MKQQKPNRLISRTAAMLLMMLLTTATARAQQTETVSFTDENGQTQSVTATVVTADMEIFGNKGGTTWYLVKDEITHNGPIFCFGNVNFILGVNGTMKIYVNNDEDLQAVDNSGNLTIYDEVEGQGYFYVESHNKYGCISGGSLAVHGGYVRAVTYNYAATDPAIDVTDVTVSDGTLIAWTFNSLSAIYASNVVTISGGYVNALTENTSSQAKAITANNGITVSGGILEANGRNGYGIISNNVNILGGTVTASGYFGIYGLSGTINLDWTNTTDRFKAGRCARPITIADGKYFKDDSGNIYCGTLTDAQKSAIVNVELQPATEAEYNAYVFAASDDGNTYTIRNADGWNLFCDVLDGNGGKEYFSGKTVKLGEDIGTAQDPITRRAGSADHDFTGHFDGQGHTLYVRLGTAEAPLDTKAAPFQNVTTVNSVAASIENLCVCGDIYARGKYAGGIIGSQYGNVTLRNCRSSVNIHSSVTSDTSAGGLVGNGHNNLTIEGCLFDGSLTAEAADVIKCAGFVGYYGSSATLSISNSLVAPASVTIGTGTDGTISATFARGWSGTPANSYYATNALGTAQGKQARSITAGEGVSVANAGAATEYAVSGITSYGTGIKYGGVLYAGKDDEVSLTLSNTAPEGYIFSSYTASDGTLIGDANPCTLNMPDADVMVTAKYLGNCWHVPEAAQPKGTYMRNPTHPYASSDVSIYNGNLAYGDEEENPGDQNGGTIYYRATGATMWQTVPMEYDTQILDNKYWRGTIPANELVEVEYFIEVTYNDHDVTYLGLATAGDVASTAFRTLDEAAAHPFSFTYAVELTGGGATTLYPGWYVVNSDITYTGTVTLAGDVNLILADGKTMNIGTEQEPINGDGIVSSRLGSNDEPLYGLTIYGQSTKGNNVGTLKAYSSGDSHRAVYVKNYTQYGGNVTATGDNGIETYQDVTITGGRITATGTGVAGYGIFAGGSITLGWTKASDFIKASSYGLGPDGVTVKIAVGQTLYDEGGYPYSGDNVSIPNGKTLRPYRNVLALDDAADNSAAIAAAAVPGASASGTTVVLAGRTLYKDGAWNTLCLPFDLTIAGSPLDGDDVDVRTLDTTSFDDAKGELTLNFTPAPGQDGALTTIEAGKPYIIKWPANGEHLTENDLVFQGVTIPSGYTSAEAITAALAAATAGSEWVDFRGTFSPQPIYTADNTNLYLGTDNTLYYPTATTFTLNACRAYFHLNNGLTAGTPNATARQFVLNFGEETGITTTNLTNFTNSAGAWYTLDGQRLDAQPTRKGLYIHGGRKVVIK